MRFNNRACALMEIPDLPQGAFEHIGDRKIKPQGGGGIGDFFSPITDPISDVLGTSGGGGGILGAVEDVGKGIGSIGESIDKAVTQPIGKGLAEVDKFVGREIPGGWALPAAIATYYAAPYAAPYLTGSTAAAGAAGAAEAAAALEAAALAEGATTAGMVAAANTGLPAGTATLAGLVEAAAPAAAAAAEVSTALPYTEAFDAVNLAQQGLSQGQIAQTLELSAGVDKFIAADMASLASQGLSPDQIVQTLSYSYSPAELKPLGIESKALGLPKKGLTAGQALQGARLASGLLAQRPQQPQLRQPQLQMPQIRPAGAVDYSGLLGLITPRMAARNPNSLLG
jgi:hypothetical protein